MDSRSSAALVSRQIKAKSKMLTNSCEEKNTVCVQIKRGMSLFLRHEKDVINIVFYAFYVSPVGRKDRYRRLMSKNPTTKPGHSEGG